MWRILSTLCVLSVVLSASVGTSADPGRQRTRPGSFAHYSIYSVDDLVREISTNPAVAKRYTTHFGVSKEKLIAYFKQNLRVVTLRAPLRVTTYFLSKSGKIASKQRTLPAGRQVFVTADNKPVLEIGCGNPVTKQMPEPKREVKREPKAEVKPLVEEVKPLVETVGELPTAEVIEEPVVEAIQPEVVAQLPILEPIAAPIEVFRAAPSILKLAAVMAPLAAGLQYTRASQNIAIPDIPEPSSLVALAIPSLGFASALVMKRRAARK